MVRTVDGVTTAYLLDLAAGLTQVLQETTGGQTTSYLYGHDLLAQYDSGTWAYHLNDGLGSVRQLADPAGQVVASYSFSPFGVPLGESGGEPYGFTGEQWDASAGLVYLRARYYEPGVGRFISVGIAQIRPETAVQIEQAGLLYEPGPSYDPYTGPLRYEAEQEWTLMPHRKRVGRLLDPVWAIEYAAANMDLATQQKDYLRQIPIYDRYLTDWEKMACWYNRGLIDIWAKDVDERDRDALLNSYLPATWRAMLPIQGTDLLGIKAKCTQTCP